MRRMQTSWSTIALNEYELNTNWYVMEYTTRSMQAEPDGESVPSSVSLRCLFGRSTSTFTWSFGPMTNLLTQCKISRHSSTIQ